MYKLKTYVYIRKDKIDKRGKAPVYLRVSENGSRIEISLRVKVCVDAWDSERQRATGNSSVNDRIQDALSRINTLERKYIGEEKPSLEKIKRDFQGKPEPQHYYLKEWDKLLENIESSIGKEYSEGTFKKYKTTRKHFKNYLFKYYNKSDIQFKDLSIDLINGYYSYLSHDLDFKHNTVIRYTKNTKVVFNKALKRGWVKTDPFIELDLTYEKTERTCLNSNELKRIIEKEIDIERLDKISDYFVFSCFTGLSFADISRLKVKNINPVEEGFLININRKKTNNPSYIPLLPEAKSILEKYNWDNKSEQQLIFNIPSNQKYNAYLKELADICEINKKLTTHVARHTFATTVTLEQGVSIESVGNMLGHSQLRTTQIYSKVTQQKVLKEMRMVSIDT